MFFLSLLLPLACCVGAARGAVPPVLDVGNEVIVLKNLTNKLEIRCEGAKELHWNWTSLLPTDEVIIKTKKQMNNERPFVSTLTVQDPLIADTGFFRCRYASATNLVTDKENVDSTYVYIHDGTTPFVEVGHSSKVVRTNEKLELDCRTTLPNFTVTLTKDGEDITSRAVWDPKAGFVMRNLAIQDSGVYSCQSQSQMKTFHVEVKPSTMKLQQPNVYAGSGQLFVVGHAFTLNCSLVKGSVNATLHWTYPNAAAMYKTKTSMESGKLVSSLIVPKASTKDSGKYTCQATAKQYSPTEHFMNIEVKEKIEPFINITSTDKITVNESDSLKWRAEVVAFPPQPIIVYKDWRGRELQETDRIGMDYQPATASSRLWISNVTGQDFGQYTLVASTRDGAANKSATVTIEVKSPPLVEVREVPSYLPPGAVHPVTCRAQGFPVPSLVWKFQSCPNGPPSCSILENAVSEDARTYPEPGNLVESRVSIKLSYSGFLQCEANNSLGAAQETVAVAFSDIAGLFVLRYTGLNKTTDVTNTNSLTTVTNDDFRLLCGGNKLHYKSVKMVVPSRSGLVVNVSESQFSMKQEVAVARVTLALAGTYSCTAQPHNTSQTAPLEQVIVTVLKEAPVKFLEDANIARNETVVVESVPFFINCTVTGTPAPTITWKIDDKPLTHDFLDGKTAILSNDLQRLQLTYVLKDKHVGVYTCSAENRLNRVTGTLALTLPVPGLNKAARIGLAAALIGLGVLAVVVMLLVKRIKTERKFRKSFRQNELWLFEKGNVTQLNPDCPADEQAELLPYGEEWEVPREHITVGKQLGSGAFGRVVKASVTGLEGPAATTVAIKMCKSQADASQVRALTLELKIMIHLGKHLNIVNLMGANTTHVGRGELWILVEFCRFGNLLVFMHRHRRSFINQIDQATGKIDHLKLTPDHASLTHPLSPTGSGWWQTSSGSNQYGVTTNPGTPLILAAPPSGHNPPHTPQEDAPNHTRNQMHNPLYSAAVMSPVGEGNVTPHSTLKTTNSIHAAPESCSSDGAETNLSSLGSDGRTHNAYVTSSLGSRAPLSPTESGLGEAGLTDSHGNPFVHDVGSVPGVNAPFSTSDLVCWAWQVAQGMDYLTSRKVLHGDLAARNLLLADDNVVKISDFGLSRDMYKKDVYMKKGDDLMPIKWISVEAIRDRIFSVQSDVWAFGVTLWEIFSLGSTPYPGTEVNKDFLPLIEAGYRMECPKYANDEIYKLLLGCWEAEPRDRPSFRQAAEHLCALMLPDIAGEYLSMNDQYMRMNEERFRHQTDYLNMFTKPDYENMTTRTDDEDLKPHYVNMQVTAGGDDGGSRRDTAASGQISMLSPEAVGYCNMSTFSPLPSSASQAHYLPMSPTRGSPSPENDVFSPRPVEPARFTFVQEDRSPPADLASRERNPFLNAADAKDRITATEQSTLINRDT